MVMYCSVMVYNYYSFIGFLPIKHNEEGKDTHNGIFNNIPYFIKNWININCLQYGFVVYNDKVLICKQEVVPTITGDIIQAYICKNN